MNNNINNNESEIRQNIKIKRTIDILEQKFLKQKVRNGVSFEDMYNDYTSQIDELDSLIANGTILELDNNESILQKRNRLELERDILILTSKKYNDNTIQDMLNKGKKK